MTNAQMEISSESEVATRLPVATPVSTTLDCAPQTLLRLRNSIGMFLAWRSSARAPPIIRLVQGPF